jgi:hypothetical protein
MTPVAFRAYAQGRADWEQARAENDRHRDYNLAVLVRAAVGSKRMPDYKRFFPEGAGRGEKKPMTDEQMYQQVLALNKALGGTVKA